MLEADLRLILLVKGNIHILYPDFMTGRNNTPFLKAASRPSDNFLFYSISKIQKKIQPREEARAKFVSLSARGGHHRPLRTPTSQ